MEEHRSLSCLNCGEQMATSREHGITIDYCPDCGGVWLDPGELEQLTGRRYHFGRSKHGSHGHHHSHGDDDEFEAEEEEEGGFFDSVVDALGGGEGEDGGFGGEGGGFGGDGGGGGGGE